MSFQNKVVAEFGDGNNRSFAEFPFRCTYKKVTSLREMVHLKPLYKQGLGITLISSLRRSNIHTCSKLHNEIETPYPGVTGCPLKPNNFSTASLRFCLYTLP